MIRSRQTSLIVAAMFSCFLLDDASAAPGGSRAASAPAAWTARDCETGKHALLPVGVPDARVSRDRSAERQGYLANLPLVFVENLGQWDTDARFVARRAGMLACMEEGAITLQKRGRIEDDRVRTATVRLSFEGSSAAAEIVGEQAQAGSHNFFVGSDPARWRTDVRGYASVLYRQLYRGIDLRLRDSTGELEYDLLLEAGANLDAVVIRCEGVQSIGIDVSDDTLVLRTAAGELRQKAPVTWQVGPDGERQPVACAYRVIDEERYGFTVAERNPALAMVIDPGLDWSTFLGGLGSDEWVREVAVDSNGVVTIGGRTDSPNFPTTPGAYDESFNGSVRDAFVARLDPSASGASQLLWSTYLGGTAEDSLATLCLHPSGAVTATGGTQSADFPTVAAFDSTSGGNGDTWVATLDPNLSGLAQLVWSTYLGSDQGDYPGSHGISVDQAGIVTLAGRTGSADFPTTPGAFDTSYNGGELDVFIARLDPSQVGTGQLLYATFYGGSTFDSSDALWVDSNGIVTLGGWTDSVDLPVTPGAFDTSYNGGLDDGYVARFQLASAGAADLLYATYFGGSDDDGVNDIHVDAAGIVTITGSVASSDLPTTPGAYNTDYQGGSYDAFLTRFALNGSGVTDLVYSSYLGGTSFDYGYSLAGQGGAIMVSGYTGSASFPVSPCTFDASFSGPSDSFVMRLRPNAQGLADLVYSSFIGGSNIDLTDPGALAVDAEGRVLIAGQTNSNNFPTTPDAFDTTKSGGYDCFVTRLLVTSWSNYGQGWSGTNGIPSFTASTDPLLCTTIQLLLSNSRGAGTQGALFIGVAKAELPTAWDAELLVLPTLIVPISIPVSGLSLPVELPCESSLCGLSAYLQVLELDPGASKDVSFTPGLRLTLGE